MTVQQFYGQAGEDYLLEGLFEGVTDGFYVDIGAFDGIHLSNTYGFELRGWSGLCVEPHPDYFPLLQKNRPSAICVLAACVGAHEAETTTFQSEDLGLFSGIAPDPAQAQAGYASRGMSFTGFRLLEVPARTFDELMSLVEPRRQIDILSLGAGGTEAEILRAADLRRHDIRSIVVAAHTQQAETELNAILKPHGFRLVRKLGGNLIFARAKDDVAFLRYRRVSCRIADTVHPLGETATPAVARGGVLEDRSRWLTDNVLCQATDQLLSSILEFAPQAFDARRGAGARLVHVVNLYEGDASAKATQAQTVRTMLQAAGEDVGPTVLVNVQSAQDPDLTPEGFVRAADLDRTVLDLASFAVPRPLPLLFDVLERGAAMAEADDYIIYSNSDICLRDHFYSCVRDLISYGFDAITINRRTVAREPFPEGLSLAKAEIGFNHGGFDCFVFRKSVFEQLRRNDVCLATWWVSRALLFNLMATSQGMLMLKNVAMTYHYGNDAPWRAPKLQDYGEFNLRQLQALFAGLKQSPSVRERLARFITAHGELPQVRAAFEQGLD